MRKIVAALVVAAALAAGTSARAGGNPGPQHRQGGRPHPRLHRAARLRRAHRRRRADRQAGDRDRLLVDLLQALRRGDLQPRPAAGAARGGRPRHHRHQRRHRGRAGPRAHLHDALRGVREAQDQLPDHLRREQRDLEDARRRLPPHGPLREPQGAGRADLHRLRGEERAGDLRRHPPPAPARGRGRRRGGGRDGLRRRGRRPALRLLRRPGVEGELRAELRHREGTRAHRGDRPAQGDQAGAARGARRRRGQPGAGRAGGGWVLHAAGRLAAPRPLHGRRQPDQPPGGVPRRPAGQGGRVAGGLPRRPTTT